MEFNLYLHPKHSQWPWSSQVFDQFGSFLSYVNTSGCPLYGPQVPTTVLLPIMHHTLLVPLLTILPAASLLCISSSIQYSVNCQLPSSSHDFYHDNNCLHCRALVWLQTGTLWWPIRATTASRSISISSRWSLRWSSWWSSQPQLHQVTQVSLLE